ncbi:hypothetical protein H4R26_002844, partial [Coemansia thaxteri]
MSSPDVCRTAINFVFKNNGVIVGSQATYLYRHLTNEELVEQAKKYVGFVDKDVRSYALKPHADVIEHTMSGASKK